MVCEKETFWLPGPRFHLDAVTEGPSEPRGEELTEGPSEPRGEELTEGSPSELRDPSTPSECACRGWPSQGGMRTQVD